MNLGTGYPWAEKALPLVEYSTECHCGQGEKLSDDWLCSKCRQEIEDFYSQEQDELDEVKR